MHLNKLTSQAPPLTNRAKEARVPASVPSLEASALPADGFALSPEQRETTSSVKPGFTPSEATATTPLQPESGRIYVVNQNQRRSVQLSFDDAATAFIKNAGLQVDLEGAALITTDGRAIPLDSRVPSKMDTAQGYAVASGAKLPADTEPWQFRVPGTPNGIFGKPHGVRVVGGDQGLGMKFLDAEGKLLDRGSPSAASDDFQGFRVDTRVFRKNRSATLGQVASHVPSPLGLIGPAALPFQDTSFPNVTLRAPSKESLSTVKTAFGKLLGTISAERSESFDLKTLEKYEGQFQALLSKEVQAGGEIDGFAIMQKAMELPLARQAMEDLYGPWADKLENGDLLNAVAEKAQKASPLEIVVIPKDKTAADCVDTSSEEEKQHLQSVGRAWFQTSNPIVHRAQTGDTGLPAQRLFIGEEILQSDKGVKAVLMHELLHIFEQRYASPEEVASIDDSFEDAKEFQSLYGSHRDEYLTTVSEEFLAAHGPDGPAWVKDQHPRLFALLSKLTSL